MNVNIEEIGKYIKTNKLRIQKYKKISEMGNKHV
jgi:hypothetical protein